MDTLYTYASLPYSNNIPNVGGYPHDWINVTENILHICDHKMTFDPPTNQMWKLLRIIWLPRNSVFGHNSVKYCQIICRKGSLFILKISQVSTLWIYIVRECPKIQSASLPLDWISMVWNCNSRCILLHCAWCAHFVIGLNKLLIIVNLIYW